MQSGKFRSMLAASLIAFCLTTASIGGAYSTAFAATVDETQDNQGDASQSATSDKAAIGLAALGLLAVLSGGHHGQDQNSTTGVNQSTTTPPSSTPSTQTTNPSTTTSSSSARPGSSSDRQLAFKLLNADRAANGMGALQESSALDNLAQKYAQDMINRHFFSHTDPDGKSPFDRMRAAGISYGYAGENIAINTSVSAAETAFMNSSGHRANILGANYKKVGLGVAYDANGSVYVVQEFTD